MDNEQKRVVNTMKMNLWGVLKSKWMFKNPFAIIMWALANDMVDIVGELNKLYSSVACLVDET